MFAGMHRLFRALLVSALVGVPVCAAAAPPLLVTFKNDSGLADSRVYIGFVGGSGSQLVATNVATGQPLFLSQFQDEHWYKLNTLRSGISLTKLTGGRIYVGYDTPWTFLNSGYEPPPAISTDPNYTLRYDKMEMTYTGNPADVADTTSIDYFSIPLALNVYQGGTSGTLVGSVTGSPVNPAELALRRVTVPVGAAVVKTTKGFVRVIGPGVYPPPPGQPASPYNDFESYLTYLYKKYAPKHGHIVATVKGHFYGVGNGSTAQTAPQDYAFTATIDPGLDITLTGSGTVVGPHTLFLSKANLVAPTGIYGANPSFSLDGGQAGAPQNDVYGWIIGDLLAGLNVGAVGSTVIPPGGTMQVGEMNSQDWFTLPNYFGALQPTRKSNYNRWAAALAPLSQAYNFAYSDRFAHVVATLNPGAPSFVDTLQIVFLGKKNPAGH